MTAILARISLQAEKLPKKERLILAEHLLESADEISSTEWDRLWIAEIKRRYKRFLSGKTKSRSSEDVFRDIRKRFKK